MPERDPFLARIPRPYRILLLYLEPLMAFNGALLCLFAPALFLSTFSPYLKYHADNQIIYNQLAATYTLFAFNQAVVLRVAKDLRVWRAIVLGILVCDTVHLWAGFDVMRRDGTVWPGVWRAEDWVAVGSLVVPMGLRTAFLAGIGVKEEGNVEKKVQ
ncbi:hypothetical protein DPSP01_002232 [Paraphaeosphaeria sporulosa]|uniref:DUF7704 domain-containing protein n=1 Tax=Paraphaeosphaeria sporulosa TaxID=1460663 RepID=A0A177C1Y1_9PLEO|nr:uncharacterized protein CC84DRAFT_1222126 [Paraphaeosphaeria sporulosa]OAG00640.1 hypothetical protein CC84DRAFT_1222126 [Paraphaeosphaeria sporulosa]